MSRDEFVKACIELWRRGNELLIFTDALEVVLAAYDEQQAEIERLNMEMASEATGYADMETAMDTLHAKVDDLRKENDRLTDEIEQLTADRWRHVE